MEFGWTPEQRADYDRSLEAARSAAPGTRGLPRTTPVSSGSGSAGRACSERACPPSTVVWAAARWTPP